MAKNYSSYPQAQYASSRKVKQEEKKLTQQIVLFLVLAVSLILLFLFVILPTVIRILASLSANVPIEANDVPIQVPFLSAPIAATSSASLVLSGYSQKGYTVSLVDNGQPLATTNTNDDGSFQVDITLMPGENKITVYAIDQSQKESPLSQAYTVMFDDQAPTLEITQPQDKQSFSGKQNQNLTITGTTDKDTKVYVNDRLIFVKDDGSFSTTFPLKDGDNALIIKAIDQAGNSTEKPLTVSFH